MSLYLGIDLGTSSVKVLLVHEDGTIAGTASREYPLSFPAPGWSEQDPADWWSATVSAVREVLAGIDPSSVAGIGCGGQMHGLVILDAQDEVIRPAILWNDGRTGAETAYLNDVIGRERLSALTANVAFAGFTAPKLLWVKKHEPENFARIAKIMLPKDYVSYRLTGVHCTDCSDAAGMLLLDVAHRRWSREMCEICSVKESQLPRLYESSEVVGTLSRSAAEALGLPASVRVCAGAGDNAAAAVGTGTVGEGTCNISVGTSGTVFIPTDTFRVDPHNALHAFCHADGGYHLMGCMLSAASCNKWFCSDVLGTKDFAAEEAAVAPERLGRSHVFFLPYLMGERSPINDVSARGTFVGMTMDTSRADMYQSVLEGVAFGLRDSLEVARSLGIAVERSMLCGGGAKSPLWRKILANVLALPLDLPQSEEGPGCGGAMLAMVACGAFPSVRACAKALVRTRGTVEPEPDLIARYEERYRQFSALYPALKEFFRTSART